MEKEQVELVVGEGPGEEVSSRAIVGWKEGRRQRALGNPSIFRETTSSNTKYLGISLTRHR